MLTSAHAQQYHFRTFNQSSGISSSNVKKIIQDSYGFIWLGTQDGLSRIDGKNALVIRREQLDGSNITDLFFDSTRKTLWIAFSLGGVNAINATTLQTVFSLKKLSIYHSISAKTIFSLLLDRQQKLWLGTDGGLFMMPDTRKDVIIPVALAGFKAAKNPAIQKIMADENGDVVVAASGCGAARFREADPAKAVYYPFVSGSPAIFDLAYNKITRSITLSTRKGLYTLNRERSLLVPLPTKLPAQIRSGLQKNVYCCQYDKDQSLWLSTDLGLMKMDKTLSSIQAISLTDANKSDFRNVPLDLFFDAQQNVWVGTMTGCYYAPALRSPFTVFTRSEKGNPLNHLYFLYPQPHSLLACDESGLYKLYFDSQKIKVCDSNKLYYLFFKDFQGNTFCSNHDGVFLWNDETDRTGAAISKMYPEWSHYDENPFCTDISFGDSILVLGSDNSTGIYIWNLKQRTITNINEITSPYHLPSGTVNMLYKKDDHSFWILSDSYVCQFDLNDYGMTDLTPYLKDQHYFFDIVSLRSKTYIACYGTGILELDDHHRITRVFSTTTGLSNNCVYRLLPQNDSLLWATTNFGLNRINLFSGRTNAYFTGDGLHADEFEEFSATSFLGKMAVGGLNGFTIVDPSDYEINKTKPLVYFTNLTVESKEDRNSIDIKDLSLETISIPEDWLQVTVFFTGLNYSNPFKVKYQYKIKELDSSWRNNDTRNFIMLLGLVPGSYTLELKACNEDGYWSLPKTLRLVFRPKWYQTWWFKTAVVMTLLGLLYSLYRYRVDQLKKQQQIRRDIASDLHDDIGSTLNSVKVFTHLAKIEPGNEEYLNLIEQSLVQTTSGLRDMIWVLDDSDDTLRDVTERIQKFAVPVANAHLIHFQCSLEISDNKQRISKTEKRNLLLIAKETINNSIKYAGCKHIEVTIKQHKNDVALTIKDDGIGFDTSRISPGNGLKNIAERARQIRFRFEILSSAGNGTRVAVWKKKR